MFRGDVWNVQFPKDPLEAPVRRTHQGRPRQLTPCARSITGRRRISDAVQTDWLVGATCGLRG